MSSILDQIKEVVLSKGSGVVRNSGLDPYHSSSVRFVDLRSHNDFESCHVTGAYSSPLPSLAAETNSPFDFGDIQTLLDQSKELNAMLEHPEISQWFFTIKSPLVVLDYNGDTSRVMTANLRARGVEAYSFRDGISGLMKYLASQRSLKLEG